MVQLALSQLYVTIFALVEIKNLALNLNSVCVYGGGELSTGTTLYPYSTQAKNRHELIFYWFGGIREVSLNFFLQS